MSRLCRVKTGIIRGFFRQSKTASHGRYGGTCTKVINTLDFWHHSWCGGGAYTSRQRQKRHLKVGKETPLENTNHLWIRRDTAVSGRIFSEFRSSDKIEAIGERNCASGADLRSNGWERLQNARRSTRSASATLDLQPTAPDLFPA